MFVSQPLQPDSYAETLTCDSHERWASGRWWSHGGGAPWWNECPYRKRYKRVCFLSAPDMVKIQEVLSSTKRRALTKNLIMPTSLSQASVLQLWEVSVCCLSHLLYGILLYSSPNWRRQEYNLLALSLSREQVSSIYCIYNNFSFSFFSTFLLL